MSVNEESAASRQFVAHPPFWGSKLASKTMAAYQNPVKFVVFVFIYLGAIIAFCAVLGIAYQAFQGSRQGFSAEIADKVFRYGGCCCHSCGFRRLLPVVSTPKDPYSRHERWPDCQ